MHKRGIPMYYIMAELLGVNNLDKDMAILVCKECGGIVSDKATNCPHCGAAVSVSLSDTPQTRTCLECGRTVDIHYRECPNCGCPFEGDEESKGNVNQGHTAPVLGHNTNIKTNDIYICPTCGCNLTGQERLCPRCGRMVHQHITNTLDNCKGQKDRKSTHTIWYFLWILGVAVLASALILFIYNNIPFRETKEDKGLTYMGDGLTFGVKGAIQSIEYLDSPKWTILFDENNIVKDILMDGESYSETNIIRNHNGQISELWIGGVGGMRHFEGVYTYNKNNQIETLTQYGYFGEQLVYEFDYKNNDLPSSANIITSFNDDDCQRVEITNPKSFKTCCVLQYKLDDKENWTSLYSEGQFYSLESNIHGEIAGHDFSEDEEPYYYNNIDRKTIVKRIINYR